MLMKPARDEYVVAGDLTSHVNFPRSDYQIIVFGVGAESV